jgi:transposase
MSKPYSIDLREQVVAAVQTGELSCNQTAKQFEVGISTAFNWIKRWRQRGGGPLALCARSLFGRNTARLRDGRGRGFAPICSDCKSARASTAG